MLLGNYTRNRRGKESITFAVDFVRVADCPQFDPNVLYGSFQRRVTQTMTEMEINTNMAKANHAPLGAGAESEHRIFEVGRSFFLHEPFVTTPPMSQHRRQPTAKAADGEGGRQAIRQGEADPSSDSCKRKVHFIPKPEKGRRCAIGAAPLATVPALALVAHGR